ncbi:MAG TPA: hypothetical protein VFQ53_38915 [Kofleriaceae bacterium]|nr:hypothetical protein [Kofleriaceae bacterium]
MTGAPAASVPALAVLAGTYDDVARTDRVVSAATDALRSRGYAHAAVAVTRRAGCFVDLDVAVALGPKFTIDRIEFVTDDAFPAGERLAVIEDALGTVNTRGGVYIEYRLARALPNLERRYQDAGWLDARIGAPSATFDDASSSVTITIPVTAGPRFRIAAIRARGAGAAARRAVLDEIALAPGAYYDGKLVRSGLERARRKLARTVELRTNVLAERREIELEAVLDAPEAAR